MMEHIITYKEERMKLLHRTFLRQQTHTEESLKQSTEKVITNNDYLDKLSLESIIDGVEYEGEFAPNAAIHATDSPRQTVENIAIHAIKADVRNGWKKHPVSRAKSVNKAIEQLRKNNEYDTAAELLDSVYTPDSATLELEGEEAYVTRNRSIIQKHPEAIWNSRISPFITQLSVNTLYWWLSQEHGQYLD